MKQYTVRSGQNIYDVALTLYGTVEGIFDLLISNDWLTMESALSYGMTVNYHEDFVINSQMAEWIKDNNILVKNGEHIYDFQDVNTLIKRHISTMHPDIYEALDELSADEQNYYWEWQTVPKMAVLQQGQLSTIAVSLKDNTHLFIDWGDYTDLQTVEGEKEQEIEHCYKSEGTHQITMYGDCRFNLLNIENINGIHYPLAIIYADTFKSAQKIEELNKLIITQ